jgi:hypothetical protein
MTTTNATSQHHHPACKQLLIGRYGGADDDDQEGEPQMMVNNEWQEQPTTGMTNNGNNQQWGTTNSREWQMVGNDKWMAAGPHPHYKCKMVGLFLFLFQNFIPYVATLHHYKQLLIGCLCIYFIYIIKLSELCQKNMGKTSQNWFLVP